MSKFNELPKEYHFSELSMLYASIVLHGNQSNRIEEHQKQGGKNHNTH